MPAQIGSVVVALDVDIGRISRFRDAAQVIDRDSNRIRSSVAGATRSLSGMQGVLGRGFRFRLFGESLRTITRTTDEIQRMRAAFIALSAVTGVGFTGALSGAFLVQTADRARLLTNQLKTVTDSSEELVAVQERLFDISQTTRQSFDATTKIYARTARATEHLQLSQEKLFRITETIQKAFVIGGATQAEATGAAIQLSQGIASDRLSGEELRSLLENAPRLAQGMARALGVTIGKLREMGHAGELTAARVTEAIIGASTAIDEEFDKTAVTVGQAITRLDNAFLFYIQRQDESLGITRRLAGALSDLSKNFDVVGDSIALLIGGGLSAAGGRLLSAPFRGLGGIRAGALEEVKEIKNALTELSDLERQTLAQIGAARKAAALGPFGSKQQLEAIALQNRLMAEHALILNKATAGTNALAAAQRRATIAGAALAGLARAGSSVLAFLGGPIGIAFTGLLAGLLYLAERSARAAEETEKVNQKLRDLGLLADEAGTATEKLAKSIEDRAFSELLKGLKEFEREFDKTMDRISDTSAFPAELFPGGDSMARALVGSKSDRDIAQQFATLRDEMLQSRGMSDDLRRSLENLAEANPEIAEVINELIRLGGQLNALTQAQTLQMEALEKARNLANNAFEAERVEAGAQLDFNKILDDTRKFTSEIERVAKLGDDERKLEERSKKILEDVAKINEDKKQTILLTEAEARALAELEMAEDKRREKLKESTKEAERFTEGMDKLRLSALAAPLGEFGQEVVSTAQSLGIATDEIEAFIRAVLSGGLDAAPEKFREIAAALKEVEETERFQRNLNEQFQFFGNIAIDALDKVGDKTADWREELDNVVGLLKRAALEAIFLGQGPLAGIFGTQASGRNQVGGLFGIFASAFSGAGAGLVGGSGSAALTGIYHGGGIAGRGRAFRTLPTALFTNAPRFHSGGLAGNEIPAVLRRGEGVFTPEQMAAMGSTTVSLVVDVRGARGNKEIEEMVAAGVKSGMDQVRSEIPAASVAAVANAKILQPTRV